MNDVIVLIFFFGGLAAIALGGWLGRKGPGISAI